MISNIRKVKLYKTIFFEEKDVTTMANQTADMKHEGMTTMPSVTELVTSSEPVNFEKDVTTTMSSVTELVTSSEPVNFEKDVTTTVNQKGDMKHEPVEQDVTERNELVSKSLFEEKISSVLDEYFRNISNLTFLE